MSGGVETIEIMIDRRDAGWRETGRWEQHTCVSAAKNCLVNASADTSAIDNEDGAIFGHPSLFCARIPQDWRQRAPRGVMPQHVKWRLLASMSLNLMATDELRVNPMDSIYYFLGLTWRLVRCIQLVNIRWGGANNVWARSGVKDSA
jgi:hypothetical protein